MIGDSLIGNNVIIAADSFIKDQNIGCNVMVFGSSPHLILNPNKNSNLAIIPARGGSKRIPHKNIKDFLEDNYYVFD